MTTKHQKIDGELLSRYIDNDLKEEELEEFEADLANNEEAQKELESLQQTLNLIGQLSEIQAPETFAPKIRQKVRRIRSKRRNENINSSFIGHYGIWVGMVISILVLLYLMMQLATLN